VGCTNDSRGKVTGERKLVIRDDDINIISLNVKTHLNVMEENYMNVSLLVIATCRSAEGMCSNNSV
jgi:hypothetical protein